MANLKSTAEKNADSTRDFKEFADLALPGLKDKVAGILSTIGKVKGIFSTYTLHDISHVDAILQMLDWLIPPSTQEVMTPCDWLLITLSIYFHDLGMVVTEKEFDTRKSNPEYAEFLDNLGKGPGSAEFLGRTEYMDSEEKEIFFYQEYVRYNHPSRIREWIVGDISSKWGKILHPMRDSIQDLLKPLPTRFKKDLANVCESHHNEDLDKFDIYPLCERYTNNPSASANVQYAATMLRTADLLHITKDRTPSMMYKTIEFTDLKSVDEWKKQSGTFSVYMKTKIFDPDDGNNHVVVVKADFEEERPYFALSEYLKYANQQIIESHKWNLSAREQVDGKGFLFPWKGIERDILVGGIEPKEIKFLLDKDRLLKLLVGHTIYNEPMVAVRELLQNAIDAVRFKYYLSKRMAVGKPAIKPPLCQYK